MIRPRILIVGWGRCGKDEAGAFFHQNLGLVYAGSTSWAALPLMAQKQNLPQQLAWEQRHQHRQFWKDSCDEFRRHDSLILVKLALWGPHYAEILSRSDLDIEGELNWQTSESRGQIVTGIRDKVEIDAAKLGGLFQHVLWIDRPGVPVDPTVTFDASDATDYVRNDGDLRRFHRNLTRWAVSVGLAITPSTYVTELLLDPIP